MESPQIVEERQDVERPDLVIPAQRMVLRQSCSRPHVIDIGARVRRKPLPRVIYGSPMRCAPLQIVWVSPRN